MRPWINFYDRNESSKWKRVRTACQRFGWLSEWNAMNASRMQREIIIINKQQKRSSSNNGNGSLRISKLKSFMFHSHLPGCGTDLSVCAWMFSSQNMSRAGRTRFMNLWIPCDHVFGTLPITYLRSIDFRYIIKLNTRRIAPIALVETDIDHAVAWCCPCHPFVRVRMRNEK